MNRTPTPEEREMYNLPVDGQLFTHQEYEVFRRWLEWQAEYLERKVKVKGNDNELSKYELERARAFRMALEALREIHRGRNQYKYQQFI
jgi:hypothetical protein